MQEKRFEVGEPVEVIEGKYDGKRGTVADILNSAPPSYTVRIDGLVSWFEPHQLRRIPAEENTARPIVDETKAETCTILAALRFYQQALEENDNLLPADVAEIATNFDEVEPLVAEEIDALCEKINTLPPNDLLTWLHDLYKEIGALGFDDPHEAVEGSAAVEYLGKLFQDIGQKISK